MINPLLLQFMLWSGAAALGSWLVPSAWTTRWVFACGAGLLVSLAPLSFAILIMASLIVYGLVHRFPGNFNATACGVATIVAGYAIFLGQGEGAAAIYGSSVVLPLGMAFYALRLIHYLLESYKGHLRHHNWLDYLAYQFLPGTLLVGPIHRFDEFLRDLRRRRWDTDLFATGLQRILYGLAKLVIIGNYLIGVKLAPELAIYAAEPGLIGAYVTSLLLWGNLYILFSAYSDLAIGMAAVAGFRIRENFCFPFLARNIADFWRRWHISLSDWCRDYVYTPVLAASRNHLLAVIAAMVVLGLWHELSLRYLLWGAYHGVGIAAFRAFEEYRSRRSPWLPGMGWLWRPFATLLTLHFVLFSFPVTTAVVNFIHPH